MIFRYFGHFQFSVQREKSDTQRGPQAVNSETFPKSLFNVINDILDNFCINADYPCLMNNEASIIK